VELLRKYADSALLIFDGDAAGRKAALRTGALFLEAGIPVRVAALPPGDDPDSLLRDKGADVFRAALDAAVSLTAFQIRVLREEERDPEAIDAVNRISRAVFETLATCPQAVLRSHLLQEAAGLLHLPADALESDLESLRQKLAARPPPAPRAEAAPRRPPIPATPPAAAAAELQFCELLIHHGEEPQIAELADNFVPTELLVHADTRAIYEAWQQARNGMQQHLENCGTASAQKLLARMVRSDSKMTHAREATTVEAADGLIARLWIVRLEEERRQATDERRRLAITQLLTVLKQPKDRQTLHEALATEAARLGHQPSPTLTPASEDNGGSAGNAPF